MTKLAISLFLETSKFLATDAGKELTDFITYVSDLADQSLRALRNGVGIRDNLDAVVKTVSVKHNTDAVVNTDGRSPLAIVPSYQLGSLVNMVSAFGWTVNAQGQVVVRVKFDSAPTSAIDISLVILFS